MVVANFIHNDVTVTIHNDYCKDETKELLPIVMGQITTLISDSYIQNKSNEYGSNCDR